VPETDHVLTNIMPDNSGM